MSNWVEDLIYSPRQFTSQGGQDGILHAIFQNENIKYVNSPPVCVEFGYNSKELVNYKSLGPNIGQLVERAGFKSYMFDIENENHEIGLYKEKLTPSNICEIFSKYNIPKEPEYVSIDIDSYDLWVMDALLKEYRPLVLSVEYNGNFPLTRAITFPNDEAEYWKGDRAYGASMKALNLCAERHGYKLVMVEVSLDLFFVRADLLKGVYAPPLEKWSNYCGNTQHRSCKGRESIMIDYEVFLETGDMEKAREAAKDICSEVMTKPGNGWD